MRMGQNLMPACDKNFATAALARKTRIKLITIRAY
jgi:hypothetical protein